MFLKYVMKYKTKINIFYFRFLKHQNQTLQKLNIFKDYKYMNKVSFKTKCTQNSFCFYYCLRYYFVAN